MKAIKVVFTSLFVILIVNSFVFGQEECNKWEGPNNSDDPIWRIGKVSLGDATLVPPVRGELTLKYSGRISFLDPNDTDTCIIKMPGGGLRFQNAKLFAFDALNNHPFQINRSDGKQVFYVKPANDPYVGMAYFNSVKVGIGTTTPLYDLDVDGTIRAKEIIVENGGADFVFGDDYHLMPLDEVEQHIKKEGHLPGIPKAKEMQANGMSVGEMQTKLLQTIEELTLHMIELKKENEQLKARVASLESENY